MAEITLQQKIKIACIEADISLTELGSKMGMSQASISKRVKTGKFTQEELETMAEIMGCKYESAFVFPNGNRIG
nr:MAG TPA: helix-turn-helix domain protein [Caudoviricetes sp.]